MSRYDAIVIGGGVAGISCLYQLAQRGMTNTLLLERNHLASGSSGRSAAFIETQYLDDDQVRICVWSLRLFQQLAEESHLPFVQHGKLLITADPDRREDFTRSIDLQHGLGLEGARVLDPDQIPPIAPQLRTDDLAAALWGPQDGYTDPPTLCQILAERARLAGAQIAERSTVTAIDPSEDGYWHVRTSRGDQFTSRRIVNAAGAWAADVARMLGLTVPVSGYRRQIAIFEATPELETPMPLVVEDTPHEDTSALYFRDDTSRRLLAGLHSENAGGEHPADPDSYEETAGWDEQAAIAEAMLRRLTNGDDLTLRGGWAGLYPLTPDRKPILGEAVAGSGLFNLVGLGGNGIQMSPALGAIAAALITEEATAIVPDATRYSSDRFSERAT